MADIDHANPSPLGGRDEKVDIKRASIQVQPVLPTPNLTPELTPDEDDIAAMAGKKIFSLSRPDDKARELAAQLTLEEQVRFFCYKQE
jgi:beta-glucosidase